jgi:membrane-associated phospholipid phosphatase
MFRKFLLLQLGIILSFPLFSQQQDSVQVIPKLSFSKGQLYVPGALMVSGLFTTMFFKDQIKFKIRDARNREIPGFHTRLDNYLEYAAIPVAYGLDVFGIKSKNDFPNRTAILIKGELLMFASVTVLKGVSHETRPDGSDRYSFPSGHAAQAFATATFLSEEYKDRLPWMPYAAYTMAGTTGLLRIANNRHYLGDVLFGAGFGFLSMKAAYWTHQYKWGKNRRRSQPVY